MAASDVSQTSNDLEEPGLELTTTSLGGITSTQNIIEESETPQTKKAPLPSVEENSLEDVTNKNDADLRTRSSTTRFANKNLLAKTSRKEGQNALQPGLSFFYSNFSKILKIIFYQNTYKILYFMMKLNILQIR